MKTFILFMLMGLILSAGVMIPFAGGIFFLAEFVTSANMLLVVSLCALGYALEAFLFGFITKDYSWIDRLYSMLPVFFAWYYAYRSIADNGAGALAVCVAAVLVTLWGIRLTFNFARKGGYKGLEDYRWIYLRKKITNPVLWQLFNFSFIALVQSGLFVLFTFPVYSLTFINAESLPVIFWVLAAVGLILICMEFVSDQQQWNFHLAKKAAADKKDYPSKYSIDVNNGFLSKGLFALSRHPNYFCELGFWWIIWLIAFSLYGNPITSGGFGPVALTLIFTGSTILTESITSSKYPEYKNYKKRVISPIIPWFPKKS